MGGTDGDWQGWDDDRLTTLLTGVRDDEDDGRAEPPTPAGRGDRPTGMSLEDVVAAGRAAFCWLDVVVTLRNVTRHHGLAAGASTAREPGH